MASGCANQASCPVDGLICNSTNSDRLVIADFFDDPKKSVTVHTSVSIRCCPCQVSGCIHLFIPLDGGRARFAAIKQSPPPGGLCS